jgi:hypothetical protein
MEVKPTNAGATDRYFIYKIVIAKESIASPAGRHHISWRRETIRAGTRSRAESTSLIGELSLAWLSQRWLRFLCW